MQEGRRGEEETNMEDVEMTGGSASDMVKTGDGSVAGSEVSRRAGGSLGAFTSAELSTDENLQQLRGSWVGESCAFWAE